MKNRRRHGSPAERSLFIVFYFSASSVASIDLPFCCALVGIGLLHYPNTKLRENMIYVSKPMKLELTEKKLKDKCKLIKL